MSTLTLGLFCALKWHRTHVFRQQALTPLELLNYSIRTLAG